MTHLKKAILAIVVFLFTGLLLPNTATGQALPEELQEGTLTEQYDYLHQRTLIYNNFRAIREDMFQRIRRNSLDSLQSTKSIIRDLNQQILTKQSIRDSLKLELSLAITERDQAIADRDSLFLLGMPMSKTAYNLLLWSIIGVLTVLLLIILFMFKSSYTVTSLKTRELKELQQEFEEYRKTSRERFEQQSIDHFNELKRNKGQ